MDRLFPLSRFGLNVSFIAVLFWAAVAACPPASAQTLSPDPDDAEAEQAALEELEGLRLDLNRATAEDLKILPYLSAEAALRIESHRGLKGPFRSVADLLQVPGISPDVLDAVAPYLSVSPWRRISGRMLSRMACPQGKVGEWGQLGAYQRVEVAIGGIGEALFLCERDPGEAGLADFWSGHLLLKNVPGTDRVIVGDFRASFGQGLLFSRRTRTSPGLAWARPEGARCLGLRAATEDGAMRGLFAQGHAGRLTWAVLGSRAAWDAALNAAGCAEIREGDTHVTRTERSHKDLLKERLTGLRLSCEMPYGQVGLTAVQAAYSPPLTRGTDAQPRRMLAGLDWDLRLGRLALFGEAARSGTGDGACAAGAAVRLKDLHLTALGRRYGPDFESLRGAALSAYGTPPKNESGVFLGALYRPVPGTQVEASLDLHRRIRSAQASLPPGSGNRIALYLTQRLPAELTLALTAASQKEAVVSAGSAGNRTRARLRTSLSGRSGPLRLRAWAECVRTRSPSRPGIGRAAAAELRTGRLPGAELALWTALFRVSVYDARIYLSEPDVWGGSRLQVLSGDGHAAGLRASWGGRHARLVARYSLKRTEKGILSSSAIQIEAGILE